MLRNILQQTETNECCLCTITRITIKNRVYTETLTLLSRTYQVYSALQTSPDYLVMDCPLSRCEMKQPDLILSDNQTDFFLVGIAKKTIEHKQCYN